MNKLKEFIDNKLYFLILITFLVFIAFIFFRFFYQKGQKSLSLPIIIKSPISTPIPAPQMLWLHTEGNRIVSEEGKVVILRGVNIASIGWANENWNIKAVEYVINNWKANVIRTRAYEYRYRTSSDNFLHELETQIIKPARENHAYVLIHPYFENNNPLPSETSVAMWRAIATEYRNDPTVLYDVMAEPHDVTRAQMRSAYIKLIEEIRKINPRTLIFVSGLGWGREINSYLKDPYPYENIVYRSNPYNREGEFTSLFGEIAKVYPVFLGEFGADGHPPMTQESVIALIAFANDLGIGWTAWLFHSEGCPCLLSDYHTFTPSAYGQIVYEALLESSLMQAPSVIPQGAKSINTDNNLFYVYSDQLENSFIDLSWDAQVDLVNKDKVYSGASAVKVKYTQGHGAFYLYGYNPVVVANFTGFQFYLNWGQNQPFNFEISLNDEEGNSITKLQLDQYQKKLINGWYEITVPLEKVGAVNKKIGGIILQNATDFSTNPIYFDEIRFIK